MAKKGATGDFLFHFWKKKSFFSQNGQYFHGKKKVGKKKVEKKVRPPTGFNFSHPLERKHTFFYGQPDAMFAPREWLDAARCCIQLNKY